MNHEGIGLGLTIVKQIVTHCDGNIDVQSKGEGHGCTFRFCMKMELPTNQVEDVSPDSSGLSYDINSSEASREEERPIDLGSIRRPTANFGLPEPIKDLASQSMA